jgi:hypothetical protein
MKYEIGQKLVMVCNSERRSAEVVNVGVNVLVLKDASGMCWTFEVWGTGVAGRCGDWHLVDGAFNPKQARQWQPGQKADDGGNPPVFRRYSVLTRLPGNTYGNAEYVVVEVGDAYAVALQVKNRDGQWMRVPEPTLVRRIDIEAGYGWHISSSPAEPVVVDKSPDWCQSTEIALVFDPKGLREV